jgi:hypothetical protein
MRFLDPHLLQLRTGGPRVTCDGGDRSSGTVSDQKAYAFAIAASYRYAVGLIETKFDLFDFSGRK